MQKAPTVEEMLKAGMHFGHRTSKWHPKMAPYIFGIRGGMHIIDLVKARQKFLEALDFLSKSAKEGKVILFVGTKNQVKKPLKKAALEAGMPYVDEHWLGGLITNFAVIKKVIKKYKDLLDKKQSGKLEKYTKKERLNFEREIESLEKRVGGLANMDRIPDIIFIWDIKKEETALTEAAKMKIPVVAICDTNVNPTNVSYVIPSNDDASKTIELLLEATGKAVKQAKEAKQ